MLRDLKAGGRTEVVHILKCLSEVASRAGVPVDLHALAILSARAYDQRREAAQLASAI